jgi:hypothetical protein
MKTILKTQHACDSSKNPWKDPFTYKTFPTQHYYLLIMNHGCKLSSFGHHIWCWQKNELIYHVLCSEPLFEFTFQVSFSCIPQNKYKNTNTRWTEEKISKLKLRVNTKRVTTCDTPQYSDVLMICVKPYYKRAFTVKSVLHEAENCPLRSQIYSCLLSHSMQFYFESMRTRMEKTKQKNLKLLCRRMRNPWKLYETAEIINKSK